MKKEVCSAVDFLTQLMRPSTKDQDQLEAFNESLKLKVCGHYQDHWFPAKPFKGSGYRCLRINHQMEPIILQAAAECGLTKEDLISMLPNELTLWIDPREVSYRIGEDGSVGILYQEEDDGSHSKPAPQTKAPSPVPASRTPPVSHNPHPVNHLSHSPVSMNMNAMNVQNSMSVQNLGQNMNLGQNVSITQRHSPVSLSPSRTSPVHHSPVHSPVPLHFNSPQRRLHSPSPADFISWDMFEPSLSPSRGYQHTAPQHYYQRQQQQCGKDAYFQQHNFNDSYDLKRLAAFVYS